MKNLFKIIIFAFYVILIFFIINIVELNQNLHLKLIKKNIFESQLNEERSLNIRLIVKYLNSKKLYDNEISLNDFISKELKDWQFRNFKGKKYKIQFNLREKTALKIINFFRKIIGKSSIQPKNDYIYDLDKAIFFENQKQYNKALALFSKMPEKLPDKIKRIILLHQGFCYSILGNENEAKKNYLLLIKKYPYSNSAVTASILLNFLEIFKKEYKIIIHKKIDNYKKGIKLATLLNFKKAKDIFDHLDSIPGKEKPKVYYYAGVANDEMGNIDVAIKYYIKSIKSDTYSKYAKFANTKIFLDAEKIENTYKIREMTVKFAQKINDYNLQAISKYLLSAKSKTNQNNKIKFNTDIFNNYDLFLNKLTTKKTRKLNAKLKKQIIKRVTTKAKSLLNQKVVVIIQSGKKIQGILKMIKNSPVIRISTIIGDVEIKKIDVKKILPYKK